MWLPSTPRVLLAAFFQEPSQLQMSVIDRLNDVFTLDDSGDHMANDVHDPRRLRMGREGMAVVQIEQGLLIVY